MNDYTFDIADFRDYTQWTVLGDETTTLAASAYGYSGAGAISFAKANGTATTTYAGVYRTVALSLTHGALARFCSEDRLVFSFYVSATTDITNVELRLGTSASHHNVWKVLVASMAAGWNSVSVKFGTSTITGNGMTPGTITYAAVAFKFSAEDKALAGIVVDRVYLIKNTTTVS